MLVSSGLASAQGGADARLRPALLDVTINGETGAEPLQMLADEAGGLYASAAAFAAWRLRPPTGTALRFDGADYYPLTGLAGVRTDLSQETQALSIQASPDAFQPQSANLDAAPIMPMTPSATGLFLGYDLFLEHVRGDTSVNGAFELGAFTRGGAGGTTVIAAAGSGKARLVRLETSWVIDRPDRMTSLRIGDSISSAGPGGAPVRFAGIQYARNFAAQPGFVTMPLPIAAGTAALPSIVDIYVNNVPQRSQPVAPGPFELANVPVVSGGGTVQIVVRDLLGRQVVTEQPYYASAQMLRRGLHDFSYEAGFIRRDFGRASNRYGSFMVATSHRYGFSDRITGEAHVEGTRERQMAGVAITALAFDLGQIGASGSVSRSERGIGYRAAAMFEHAGRSLSLGVRAEHASANFAFIGMPRDTDTPRLTLQAYADMPWRSGSIGINLLHRTMRDREAESLAGLFGTVRIGSRASLQLYARHSVIGRSQTAFGANIGVVLGGRRSASASIERDRTGVNGTISYQDNAPAGLGGGFRAAVAFGPIESAQAAYVRNLPQASVGAEVAHARGGAGLRLSASGAVGIIGGRTFVSRELGESFASVRLDGYPNVRVYADSQLVGTTDAHGALVVPRLRPFEANVIRLEEADLPIDVRIARTEIPVRPFARAGAAVRFAAARERGVLMHVRLEDGSPLPAGAAVTVRGMAGTFPTVSGGEVYIPNLSGTSTIIATWSNLRCKITVLVPSNDDPQPRLDDLVCRRSPIHAER